MTIELQSFPDYTQLQFMLKILLEPKEKLNGSAVSEIFLYNQTVIQTSYLFDKTYLSQSLMFLFKGSRSGVHFSVGFLYMVNLVVFTLLVSRDLAVSPLAKFAPAPYIPRALVGAVIGRVLYAVTGNPFIQTSRNI